MKYTDIFKKWHFWVVVVIHFLIGIKADDLLEDLPFLFLFTFLMWFAIYSIVIFIAKRINVKENKGGKKRK